MQYSRRIAKYSFTIAAGSATTTQALNPDDLSSAKALTVVLALSAIGTDAIDTLDVKLQCTFDGTTFDTRARFVAVAGTTSAPRTYRATIMQTDQPLSATDEVYEITGSSTTELTAGEVKHGPFPGRRRTVTTGGMASGWRFSIVQVDADSDATFTGSLTVSALTETP